MQTLYFYHDPMCSWCWGYRPVSDMLFERLPAGISRQNVLGGLAPDTSVPMPLAQQAAISGHWKKIHDMLGTEFNFDFWEKCEARRETYPACRAVIAASHQDKAEQMINAIQRAYYLLAMNPSDLSTLELLARELAINTQRFSADLRSAEVELELQRQVRFARLSPISGFPSLALEAAGQLIPVRLDHRSFQVTLDHLQHIVESADMHRTNRSESL